MVHVHACYLGILRDVEVWGTTDPITQALIIVIFQPLLASLPPASGSPQCLCCHLYVLEYPMFSSHL